MARRHMKTVAVLAAVLSSGWLVPSCAQDGMGGATLPTPKEIESYYDYEGPLEGRVSGNVAEITVTQASRQLRRGGTLWAEVGPYVFLFSEETRQLLDDFPGLAAVRVVTRSDAGAQVATALLARDDMNPLLWQRSLNIAGKARRDGTERITLLQDLVRWGEDHTDYEYDPRFVRTR